MGAAPDITQMTFSADKRAENPSAPQICDVPTAHLIPLNFDLAADYLRGRADSSLTPELLLSVYQVMTMGTPYEGFGFKTEDNLIHARDRIVFVPAAASVSLQELEKLLNSYADTLQFLHGEEALRPIFRFTLQFILIHPFPDGNGRMSELMLMYLLYHAGYSNSFEFPVDQLLMKNRMQYCFSMRRSTAVVYSAGIRDSRPYEDFMLDCLKDLFHPAKPSE